MFEFRGSHRSMVICRNGLVASSQPLAVQAGVDILKKGGNAIDAAVAVAATLNVVEPMSTGIGGDAFALIYSRNEDKLHALNASGWSPKDLTLDYFIEKGFEVIPNTGILSISVPGAVSGFANAIEQYGNLTLKEVLQPAIFYAENGFPISELVGYNWNQATQKLKSHPSTANTYLPNGKAPKIGELFYSLDIAKTFRIIAEGGVEEFYNGSITKKIVDFTKKNGGFFSLEDFNEYESQWVNPISTKYKEYDVYQIPPNSQGIATLLMLNILKGFELDSIEHNSAKYLHLLIEAKKLAWADLRTYVADPDCISLPTEKLLSDDYSYKQQERIDFNKAASNVTPGLD